MASSRSTTGRIAVGQTPGGSASITGRRQWGTREHHCWAARRRANRAALACCGHRPATGEGTRCRHRTSTRLGGMVRHTLGAPGGCRTISAGGVAGPCCEGASSSARPVSMARRGCLLRSPVLCPSLVFPLPPLVSRSRARQSHDTHTRYPLVGKSMHPSRPSREVEGASGAVLMTGCPAACLKRLSFFNLSPSASEAEQC